MRKLFLFLKRQHIIAAAVVIILAIFFSHGSLIRQNFSEQHWEDKLFFDHTEEHIESVSDCFTRAPLWPGLYRPLTTNCYYYAIGSLFENRIEIYHTINVLLVGLNSLLLFFIAGHFLPGYWALIPAAIFASRYAHVEVVLNTVEFQSLLSVFFSLLSLQFFILGRVRKRTGFEILAALSFGLALLSKETAIIVPFLILLYGWFFDSRQAWRHYLAPFMVALAWAVLFSLVFRGISDFKPTGFTYTTSLPAILFNYTAHMADFSNLLTDPLDSVVMTEAALRFAGRGGSQALFLLLVTAAAVVGVLHPWLRFKQAGSVRVFAFGFLFFLIATAPFVLFEDRLFMRYSYFGHAGLALASGVVLKEIAGLAGYLAQKLWGTSRPAINLSKFFSG